MAYTELTCDDDDISLEDLRRGSMVDMGDGTFAQQVVEAVAADYCDGGFMRLNTTHSLPSGFDSKKNGEDIWVLQPAPLNGRRQWQANDGTLATLAWSGTAWTCFDSSDYSLGLIGPTDTLNPCEVPVWYETVDGVTVGVETDATISGGVVL